VNCPFCDDLKEQETLIHKTKYSQVAINLHSLKKGHLMVMPLRHVEKYNDLTQEEAKDIFDLIEFFSEIIKKTYGDYPIITINPINGRSLPHLHIHLVPTKINTRSYISLTDKVPEREELTKDEIIEIKNKINKFL
jgi:diadenosine tetraphosphate (Ap4A) HIT family hydrolase